ncbi:hypothetical protein HD806DRAFT_519734 [Xylariaceae sp. AK1471]|nr:hypothetical protein HD806DRAFT_519734 [Xylariaceae sp. AK1471]
MIPSMNLQGTHVALLEWANAMLVLLPPGRETTLKAKKPEHLFDGAFFSLLLEILDPDYNPTRFEQSLAASQAGDETRRSMHIIHMGLIDFARQFCPKIERLIKMVDFQALDRDPTRVGMSEVLLIFLCAACFHKDNSKYIMLVQGLDGKYQSSIFQILTEIDNKLDQDSATSESDVAAVIDGARVDADLAHEAAIADLQREAEEAKRQAGGLRVRLDRLQDNYDELVRKHEELQDENEQLHKQIESEADKARLEAATQKAELLVDENQELKAKNEELSKKANMADNLRKKVEASKHLEAELTALRNDRMDLAKTYDQLTNANSKIETLKRESEAYASKMQGYEIDIANMRDQKLVLSSQNQELMIRLGELEQRSQLDEAVVKDLQEKVLMLDPSAVMDDPFAARPTSLEDELNDSNNAISMRNLEVQRLQAENAVLKSTIGSETDKGLVETIQACYEMAPDTKWLMSDYFREEAYSNLRTQVLAEQSRSKQFERQLEIIKEQLADKERALLEARGDFTAVEKSNLDALTELKNTDGMLATSLRAELEAERRKYKLLKDESEAMQKQLLAAFIDKDELRREAEHANRELQKAADGQTVSTEYIKQSEKMEKLRTRYKQLQQQYEQSEVKNRELDRTLKAVRAGTEASAQKAQTDQVIKNLQRENALISTAWYDLSSRLQSNHFVLQRRNEVPKSWLNKQRQMVNGEYSLFRECTNCSLLPFAQLGMSIMA